MAGASQKISILRYIGGALLVLFIALVVAAGLNIIFNITVFQSGSRGSILSLLQLSIELIVAGAVALWGSETLSQTAKTENERLNDKLLGFVTSSDESRFDMLAGWMKLNQLEIADRLANLASEGKLKDYAIDLSNRVVVRLVRAAEPPSQTPPQNTPGASPGSTMIGGPMGESDEIIRTKAKLYELEQLKQSGKISDPAYEKLKEEYEKKMAQADKGTQVY